MHGQIQETENDCPRLEQPFRLLNREEVPQDYFLLFQQGKHGKLGCGVLSRRNCIHSFLDQEEERREAENSCTLFHQIIYLINALTSDSFDESPSIQICLTPLAIVCSSSGSSPYLKTTGLCLPWSASVNGPCPRTRHPPGLLLLVGRRQTPFRRLDEYRRIRRQASPHETALPPASHHSSFTPTYANENSNTHSATFALLGISWGSRQIGSRWQKAASSF